MNFQTMNKQRKFMLIAAGIGIIAMFLPWITISIFGFSNSVNGMRDTGILIFLCFVAAAVIAIMGDPTQALDKTMWVLALAAAGLATLLMVIFLLRSTDMLSLLGYGFYFALLASMGLLFAVYNYRRAGYNIKDGLDSLKNSVGDKNKIDSPPPPPPPVV
ncbi:MAG: hypothetical protein ABIY51_11200 [Ferruginibacter sp.]